MSERQNKRNSSIKTHQYDDWVCLMCQNLNYSFRKTCNRCRSQTKQNNDYLIELYQASLYLEQSYQSQCCFKEDPNPQNKTSTFGQHSFPKCLFLELNGEQEDQTSGIRKQIIQLETPRWINCLIGE